MLLTEHQLVHITRTLNNTNLSARTLLTFHTMSLVNFFNNDPFFSEFDRLFDEAFARRTGGNSVQRQENSNSAPRVLRPR